MELDIKYFYVSELAPTAEIHELQKNTDKEKGETKRKRQLLGNIFAFEYEKQILDTFDFDNLVGMLIIKPKTHLHNVFENMEWNSMNFN